MPRSISLIGMSNTGKSNWGKAVATVGYTPFCCDDRIEQNLGLYLQAKGFRGIEDVAKWMGQPYEPQSSENQALYLEQETLVMEEAIRELRKGEDRLVIDTTGSVIYTGEAILTALRELSTVILLDAPASLQAELYRRYLLKPKPVIWGEMYKPLEGESSEDALARCYPLLLQSRNEMYRRLAHVVIGYDERRAPDFTVDDFLKKAGIPRE